MYISQYYLNAELNIPREGHTDKVKISYSQSSSLSSLFFGSLGLLGAWLVIPDVAPTTS
jgi:hypothetical protein